jgi:hypothetical protein
MKLVLVTQGSALTRNPGLEVANAFGVLRLCLNRFVDYSSVAAVRDNKAAEKNGLRPVGTKYL